jgi:membrane associated rhomboid family serine protease
MTPASVGFQCPECVRGARAADRPTGRSGSAWLRSVRAGIGVTATLMVVNVAVVVVTAVSAAVSGASPLDNQASPVFEQLAQAPLLVARGQWWRLVTAGFLHFGVLHLLVNMFSLGVLGASLESRLGSARFGALYGASLVGGTAAIQLFAPYSYAAGASTALYGLFGALGVLMVAARQDVRGLLVLLAVNIGISLLPGISLVGHLGGLVAGALTAGLYLALRGRRVLQLGAAAGLVVALLVVALLVPPGGGLGGS